jgi:hypothetical protein
VLLGFEEAGERLHHQSCLFLVLAWDQSATEALSFLLAGAGRVVVVREKQEEAWKVASAKEITVAGAATRGHRGWRDEQHN